jgi:hypothetical protein
LSLPCKAFVLGLLWLWDHGSQSHPKSEVQSNSQETRLDMRSNEYIESWHGYNIWHGLLLYIYIPMTDNSIDSPMISKYINSWGGEGRGVYYQGFCLALNNNFASIFFSKCFFWGLGSCYKLTCEHKFVGTCWVQPIMGIFWALKCWRKSTWNQWALFFLVHFDLIPK